MRVLGIDIETFSDVNLLTGGVYAYTASRQFEILLFAYAFDEEEIQLIDLASEEKLPADILSAITDNDIIKTAYNANFERTRLSKYLDIPISPNSWQCTAVQSAMLALPQSLAGMAQVLNLGQQKMKEGKDLIRYFCIPCKPTTTNGNRARNLPHHAPEKWEIFKDYCIGRKSYP